MKLKKVTALLLATSMVLSSVSVGTFADDELIFEPEVSATTEAGEDEAYFGDDVVTGDEQNEEDSASDETFFADEVIEDDQVNDDVIAEDSAADQEAYAFEEDASVDEPIVDGNEDIYAAIAGEETAAAETVIDGSDITTYEFDYTGEKLDVKSLFASEGANVFFVKNTASAPKGDWADTALTLPDGDTWRTSWSKIGYANIVSDLDVINVSAANDKTTQSYIVVIEDEVGKFVASHAFKLKINRATLTATLKAKTSDTDAFTWNAVSTDALKWNDFTYTGMIGTDAAPTSTEVINTNVKWNELKESGGKKLGEVDAGQYTVPADSLADLNGEYDSFDSGNYKNYTFKFEGADVKVKKIKAKVTWNTDIPPVANPYPYDGNEVTIAAKIEYDGVTPAKEITDKYAVTYDENKKTDAGSYKATVKSIKIKNTAGEQIQNFELTNPTYSWSIANQKARVSVNVNAGDNAIYAYYGEDPETILARLDAKNLVYETQDLTTGAWTDHTDDVKKTVTGTPTFKTNYEKYKNATGGEKVYKVWYVDGLTSEKYDLVATTDDPKEDYRLAVTAVPVVVTAKEFTIGVDAEPADLTDGYTLADGKTTAGAKAIKGGADALARDIKDGRIKATVTTKAYDAKPTKIGKYSITVKLEDTKTTDPTISNYEWHSLQADGKTQTNETISGTSLSIVNANKYEVVWGDFSLTFDDEEVAFDGAAHSIKMTPAVADLPEGLTVYFKNVKWVNGSVVEPPYFTAKDATNWKKEAVTVLPTETEAGKYTTYIYAESTDLKVAKWTKQTLTILSGVDAVIKQIDEAAKPDAEGKLDPEKVKAAREAYDALTEADKAKVPVSEVRKLEDAEAEVKDEVDKAAAKAVEDEIDKLPEASKATADDKAAADKAVEDYNKLTDDQKKLVPADKVKKMNDVKAAADAAGEDADKKAAKAVEDEIAALPAAADAKASDKAAADKAKADYDALTDAQKALVPADAVDKMNAVKAAADQAAEKEEEAEKELAALDEKVAAVKAAKNGVDGKAAAEAAKEAYDALSPEAKAMMTDEEQKAYDDTQEAYKKDKTFNSGEGVFRVLSNGEVTFLKPLHPENTWFVVPNQVKKNGFNYKVVKVSTKAFMGCEKATKIKIGKNVQSMGSYVFKNTPAMSKLIMLTSKLSAGKVTNTFVSGGKDKGAKLTNEVPSGKSSTYESLFKGEGGMNAGAKFTEAD